MSREIISGNLESASQRLPKKIEQVFDQPKVREMILAIGDGPVRSQIEFELVKLASLMSVGGNLNKAQVLFIADQLIDMYPNESIADFKICFQRGAIGAYGDIQRMDGITIGVWMKDYLEEKYMSLEDALMKEKENHYKPIIPEPSNVDWHQKWLDEVHSISGKPIIKLSEEEIENEGKERPVKKVYPTTDRSFMEESDRKLKHFQELTVRERHPDWSEEQIQERLKELDSHVKYSTDAKKIIGLDIVKIRRF